MGPGGSELWLPEAVVVCLPHLFKEAKNGIWNVGIAVALILQSLCFTCWSGSMGWSLLYTHPT